MVEERNEVTRAVLTAECIPAGMEQFAAFDEEQFSYIKRIIDYCDYYVLLIGGRYGSMDESGISYTEKGYDYAVSKGLDVLAFIHSAPDTLPKEKRETDEQAIKKLDAFRKKVTACRMCQMWRDTAELQRHVTASLFKTKQERPAIGWVRADATTVMSEELGEQKKIIEQLRQKNEKIENTSRDTVINEQFFPGVDDEITVHGSDCRSAPSKEDPFIKDWDSTMTWGKLFSLVAPYIFNNDPSDYSVRCYIASTIRGPVESWKKVFIGDGDFKMIKERFKALELVTVHKAKTDKDYFWELTESGKEVMKKLRQAKK